MGHKRWVSRLFGAGLGVILLCGCGAHRQTPTTPGPAGSARSSAGAATPAPQGEAKPVKPKAHVVASTKNALLKYVPETAVGLVAVRSGSLSLLHTWLAAFPAMRHDLSQHFIQRIGIDLTRIKSAVAYATNLATPSAVAILIRIDNPGKLVTRSTKAYRGVGLVQLGSDVVAAVVREGLLIGSEPAVAQGIELSQGRISSILKGGPLRDLAADEHRPADILVAVHLASTDKQGKTIASRYGLDIAQLRIDLPGRFWIAVTGQDRAKLEAAKRLVDASVGVGRVALDAQAAKLRASANAALAASGIVMHHQSRAFYTAIAPRLEGHQLVSSFTIPKQYHGMGMLLPLLGMSSAVAVPAFIKYLRKAKSVEATEALDRIKAGASAWYGAAKRPRRLRPPKSTAWQPAVSCCKQPTAPKCEGKPFTGAAFKLFKFDSALVGTKHYYQYRITTSGRGKRMSITIEAQSDLDCDGTFSNFKLLGSVENGGLVFKGPIITNEIE